MEVSLSQSVRSENKSLQTTCLSIVIPTGTVMAVKLTLDNFMLSKNTITQILNGYDLISCIENDPLAIKVMDENGAVTDNPIFKS